MIRWSWPTCPLCGERHPPDLSRQATSVPPRGDTNARNHSATPPASILRVGATCIAMLALSGCGFLAGDALGVAEGASVGRPRVAAAPPAEVSAIALQEALDRQELMRIRSIIVDRGLANVRVR